MIDLEAVIEERVLVRTGELQLALEDARLVIGELQAEIAAYRTGIRDDRHHEAVMMFVQHRLGQREPTTGGELAEWAHLMADYLYPPPDAVFDPPLRHHRNPSPKALCPLVGCEKSEPHDHPISGPYCTPPKAEGT